ncbi:MAG: HAMP domain-containing histidine kinase [Clostridia bacterium]|nr:HAMP domain-containing histidine kinase [Clostridia bacterium]
MVRERREKVRKILIVLLVCLLAGIMGQTVYIISYNNRVHTVEGADAAQAAYVDIHNRDDATSQWIKRDFALKGQTVNLNGRTVDGTFINHSGDLISSWTMTIRIHQDCFVNQAWCGTMEIRQYTGTEKENTQTLDLRNYRLEDVRLEYLYDGDLLIPLSEGDQLIYYPSEKDRETNLAPQSEMTMGMIFYYMDVLDLSDYTVEYRCHKSFAEGLGFIGVVALAVLSLILAGGQLISDIAYRNAMKENQLRQSGVASMSDIYAIIYYVNLETDELTPIHEDEISESRRPKELGAREQLLEMTRRDAEDSYQGITREFIDIATLPERLVRGSVACEYISREHGWTRIRFFPADRKDGEPLTKVIFAIQDINEEKAALRKYEEQVQQAEKEKNVRNTYLAGIASRMRAWLQSIQELNAGIIAESGEETVLSRAKKIRSIGRILSFTMDGGTDASRLAAGTLERLEEEYSPAELISDFSEIALTMTEGSDVTVETDISPKIPARMRGDVKRLEQVIIQLLSNAVHYTEKGSIRLAVYGKNTGEREHLLFSVKDTGGGLPDATRQELEEFTKRLAGHGPAGTVSNGHGLEVAASILSYLGSRLEVISTPGEGTEFYFEIEQTVVDPAPAGVQDPRPERGEARGKA